MILAPTLLLNAGSGAAIARPTFSRDFAGEKTLNNGTGPAITFTRASNATFFDASGVLQTASNDTPRFDHDPATGASRGLLIEEARTNLFERSAEFDNAYWTKTNTTVTANATTAPDGSSTADAIFETTTNGFHTVARGSVFTLDATSTASVFAKANGRTEFSIQIGGLESVRFDLSAATATVVNATGGTTGSITNVGGGWFRCVATRQSTINTNLNFILRSGANTEYAGDVTQGIYLWGAQAEAGAFATSYIPTTTAAATRAADSAIVTPISSFYNQAEGTLFAEGSANTSATLPALVSIDDTTGDERIQLRRNQTSSQGFLTINDGGVSQVGIVDGSWTTTAQTVRLAAAYSVNNFAMSFSGGTVATDSTGTLPTVTRMDIGGGINSGRLNAHIRKIAYWPRRLSNTLLQQLTT